MTVATTDDEAAIFDSDISAMVSLFRHGKGAYPRLFASIGMILGASTALMVSANMLGRLAERLTNGAAWSQLTTLIVAILVCEVINVVLTYNGRVGLARATNEIAFSIRTELFHKIACLPIDYYDRHPLGRTLTRLTGDVDGIEKFFSGSLSKVVAAIITVTTVLCAMIVTNAQFGAVIMAASMPAIIFTYMGRKPVRRWLRAYKARASEQNVRLAEFINGITIIKVFGLEDWTYDLFESGSRHLLRAGLMLVNWNSFIRPTAALLCSLPMVMILWWGGHHVLEGALSVGLVVTFVRYAERFFWPVMAMTQEIHVIQEAFTSSERIRQMLNEREELEVLGPTGKHQAQLKGEVRFRDVWMGYHPRRPVLRGITFRAHAGMKVGLVGATGSGKTTTMSLLPGLYPLLKGSIELDGRPIEQWDRKTVRTQLGMVSQEVMIFRGTLRENLLVSALAGRLPTDNELREALNRTGFKRIIGRFEHGLETKLADGGDNLSMGERQLIAFARMMIRNPKVMILDEATANIDEECERILHEALHDVMRDRTCFVIAHRLSTVRAMDHILVFEGGAIVEQGTHEELVSKLGIYTKLVAQQ